VTTALVVALLGALGSVARYMLSRWAQPAAVDAFPLGTLTVNVLGSTAVGLVMVVFTARHGLDSRTRIALTSGLLGGFTTYSSFAWETVALLERRAYGGAALNFVATSLLCLAGCAIGIAVGRVLTAE
jgi:CrcB protein